ncbi:MAG: sensor histidine kinase, partial [Myxococcales bacterium]|nr:sensor histidine kinase [Myxococcales bacterium]
LVENAVKHGANAKAEGGHVYVWATVDGGRLDVTVEDDGPGFAPHADEGDGQPFFSTKPQGTGLGLPMVRKIAQAQNGDVRFVSHPGRGTQVTLELPLAPS